MIVLFLSPKYTPMPPPRYMFRSSVKSGRSKYPENSTGITVSSSFIRALILAVPLSKKTLTT